MRCFQRITRSLALAFVIVLACPKPAQAKLAAACLDELIRGAPLILVAKITSIERFDGAKVARAHPLNVLRGNPAMGDFFVYAEPSWQCDATNAVEGETVLLFLRPALSHFFERRMAWPPITYVPATPLYTILHSGVGRCQVEEVDGETMVAVNLMIKTERTPLAVHGEDESYSRLIKLGDIQHLVKSKESVYSPDTVYKDTSSIDPSGYVFLAWKLIFPILAINAIVCAVIYWNRGRGKPVLARRLRSTILILPWAVLGEIALMWLTVSLPSYDFAPHILLAGTCLVMSSLIRRDAQLVAKPSGFEAELIEVCS